ncbi:hypothetical protein GCM10028778_22040 [Barrientosiimonas marina]|uniref:Uncharacterized protein n=1 Tax=Lentibacillus kimchii TaxID=1542911 RepID=A0ABW2UWC4_9BACI
MSHDIFGTNKAGEIIAYLRFTMGDIKSGSVYSLLDVDEYHAGVSGTGDAATFSEDQLAQALDQYRQYHFQYSGETNTIDDLQQTEVLKFFNNCFYAAKAEKTVQIFFG